MLSGSERERAPGALPAKVIASVFHTAKDGFGSAEGDKPSEWVVYRVSEVITPKPEANSADTKRIEDALKNQQSNDLFGQYMAWLQDDLGTSINQAALAQALGNSAPDTN